MSDSQSTSPIPASLPEAVSDHIQRLQYRAQQLACLLGTIRRAEGLGDRFAVLEIAEQLASELADDLDSVTLARAVASGEEQLQ